MDYLAGDIYTENNDIYIYWDKSGHTWINFRVDIKLHKWRVDTTRRSWKSLLYRYKKRNLGALCNDIQACHTYFWGTKLPIAADIEGARFGTSQ